MGAPSGERRPPNEKIDISQNSQIPLNEDGRMSLPFHPGIKPCEGQIQHVKRPVLLECLLCFDTLSLKWVMGMSVC